MNRKISIRMVNRMMSDGKLFASEEVAALVSAHKAQQESN
jgi:hypothetical protein